ncbi:hypothetical protein MN116_004427 [Schistosoma mekongi]|uniref:Neurexin n=1 Tax=Schistosoma mekongi TaxID=38744 RepID=A0AAE1ZFE5_SCHME|nr:hypothetical protein MN116_004427 [Schistosoma mekongi]
MIIIVFISQYLLFTETRENMQRTLKVELPNYQTEVNFKNNQSHIVEVKSNFKQIHMMSASSTDQHSREGEYKFPKNGPAKSYDHHYKSLAFLTLTTPKPATTVNRLEFNFITFKQSDCYLCSPAMHLYEKFRLQFTFRTSQEHGLILFNSDKQGVDFIAFELIKGYLHFVFDMGSGSQRFALTTHSVIDLYWHNVELFRNDLENNILQLYIDRNKSIEQSLKIPVFNGDIARNFNLNDPLYIGGISQHVFLKWREKLSSYHGFQGCIGNFSINGLPSFDLLNMAKLKYSKNWTLPVCQDQIINDCHNRPKDAFNCNQIQNIQKNSLNNNMNEINDVDGKQHQSYCLNDGLCLHSWTDINCACELTSFDGYRCMKAGTTFVYGTDYDNLSTEINKTSKTDENIGYLRFVYTDKARNTRQDEFVLGIQTSLPNTFHNRHYYVSSTLDNYITTLLFVTSLTQIGDFIHLFLESGIVRLNYNMGGGVVHISGPNFPIDDGFYHRIRGYRVDHQIILEVDETRHTYELNSVYGKQFNNQKVIWLGHSPQLNKTDYFHGYMTGVYYNGLLLNDLAAGLSYLMYIHVTRFGNVKHLPNFQPNFIKSKYSKDSSIFLQDNNFTLNSTYHFYHNGINYVNRDEPITEKKLINTNQSDTVSLLLNTNSSIKSWLTNQIYYANNTLNSTFNSTLIHSHIDYLQRNKWKLFNKITNLHKHVNIWLLISFTCIGFIMFSLLIFLGYKCYHHNHHQNMHLSCNKLNELNQINQQFQLNHMVSITQNDKQLTSISNNQLTSLCNQVTISENVNSLTKTTITPFILVTDPIYLTKKKSSIETIEYNNNLPKTISIENNEYSMKQLTDKHFNEYDSNLLLNHLFNMNNLTHKYNSSTHFIHGYIDLLNNEQN